MLLSPAPPHSPRSARAQFTGLHDPPIGLSARQLSAAIGRCGTGRQARSSSYDEGPT